MNYFNEIKKRETGLFTTDYPKEIEDIRERLFVKLSGTEEDFYHIFGALIMGPLYTGLCEWAIDVAVSENIKHIFPIMREGLLYSEIIKKLLNDRFSKIEVTPIWVSRKSSYYSLSYGDFNKEYFKCICYGYPMSIRKSFEKLGLEEEWNTFEEIEVDVDKAILEKNDEVIEVVYHRLLEMGVKEKLDRRIKNNKELIKKYLSQLGAEDGFVTLDIGSLGTIPQAIDLSINDCKIKKIHLFLKATEAVKERIGRGHDIRYRFANFEMDKYLGNVFFAPFSDHLYETITMGNIEKGTVSGYSVGLDGRVKEITESSSFSQKTINHVTCIQEGIMAFCIEYSKYYKQYQKSIMSENLIGAVKSFCRVVSEPLFEEALRLGKLEYDDICGRNSFISENMGRTYFSLNEPIIDINRENVPNSIWPEGLDILREREKNGKNKKSVAVYGYGFWGKKTIACLTSNYSVDIKCIIDRNMKGKNCGSIPIIQLKEIEKYDVEDIVIASVDYVKEMKNEIEMAKFSKKFIIHEIKI